MLRCEELEGPSGRGCREGRRKKKGGGRERGAGATCVSGYFRGRSHWSRAEGYYSRYYSIDIDTARTPMSRCVKRQVCWSLFFFLKCGTRRFRLVSRHCQTFAFTFDEQEMKQKWQRHSPHSTLHPWTPSLAVTRSLVEKELSQFCWWGKNYHNFAGGERIITILLVEKESSQLTVSCEAKSEGWVPG